MADLGSILSKLVLQRSPRTKVVIISGYDDFEYARKALQLQVHDYIVKPITPGEFKETLRKLKSTLDRERSELQDMERIRKQLEENLPLIKERFFNQLITGSISSEETLERCRYFGLSLDPRHEAFHCIVLDFVNHHGGEGFDIDMLRVKNVVRHHLETGTLQNKTIHGEEIHGQLAILQIPPLGIGIGDVVTDLHFLPKAFQDTIQALKMGQLQGKQGLITYRELGRTVGNYGDLLPDWPKQIGSAIKTAHMTTVYEAIDGMISDLQKKGFSLEQYQSLIERLAAVLVITFDELGINKHDLFNRDSNPFLELSRLKTFDELRSWCGALAESCIAIIRSRQTKFAEQKAAEALGYIQKHYTFGGLSIQTLCKDLCISTSYFSAIIIAADPAGFQQYF